MLPKESIESRSFSREHSVMDTYNMLVFDEEAEIADQATAQRCAMLAEAGCTLEQVRALQGFERGRREN